MLFFIMETAFPVCLGAFQFVCHESLKVAPHTTHGGCKHTQVLLSLQYQNNIPYWMDEWQTTEGD
jgi:hypothetical protein